MRRGLLLAGTAALVAGLAAPAGARAPTPARLLVTATEFRLGLSRTSIPHGAAIVQLANRGQDPHDLVLRRLDRRGRQTGPRVAMPETAPRELGVARPTLPPGQYTVFCSLPGHRGRGMRARLTVRG